MQADELKKIVEAHIEGSSAEIGIDGSHVHVTVTSEVFRGMSPVKKQQLVYASLNDKISSGEIHAVHIKTLVP